MGQSGHGGGYAAAELSATQAALSEDGVEMISVPRLEEARGVTHNSREGTTNEERVRSHIPVQDVVGSFTEVLPVVWVVQNTIGHGRWNGWRGRRGRVHDVRASQIAVMVKMRKTSIATPVLAASETATMIARKMLEKDGANGITAAK